MSALVIAGVDARDAAQFGGKAAALSALMRAGFDVPSFIAVTPEAFTENGLSAAARDLIAAQALGPGPFAVRSSGREEDGAAHSHAGQFLSLLDIPADGVDDAALKVWRSGQTETLRALTSRWMITAGAPPSGSRPREAR